MSRKVGIYYYYYYSFILRSMKIYTNKRKGELVGT
jgi:hypothetical protein